nr:MAG TPA: hypothetical protein [Caudoviricetes sp.]
MNFYYCRLLIQGNLYYLLTLVLSCLSPLYGSML